MSNFQSMSHDERRAFVTKAVQDAHRLKAEYVAAPFSAVFGFVAKRIRHAA